MYYVVFRKVGDRRLLMSLLFGLSLIFATLLVALPGLFVGVLVVNKFQNLPQTTVLVLSAIASVSLYLGWWTYRHPNVVAPRRKKVLYPAFPVTLTAKA